MGVSRRGIRGRQVSTGHSIEITIEGESIVSLQDSGEASDLWISAGLIDLQVNGYLGLDLNGPDLTAETASKLVRAMLATGVTTFLPTLITASEEALVRRLASIAEACDRDAVAAACIPYVHVEGPSISPRDGYRGAHPVEWVRPPSIAEFDRWQEACGDLVGMVTLSPHGSGSSEYIRALRERGVYVSLGHSHASNAQIEAAVDAGASLSTHLGNGIAPQIDRHPNPIWSQLADDRLMASFIADGHHLPAEALKAMVSAKGLERSILVSDTVALAGMAPGKYVAPVGGCVELSAKGRLSMEGTSTLAGAVVPLLGCVGRAVQMTGLPLADVIAMATENPGRFVGCRGGRGRLLPEERADLIRFRWDAQSSVATIEDVWLAGEPIDLAAERTDGAPSIQAALRSGDAS